MGSAQAVTLAVRDKLIDFSTFLVEEYDYYMSKDKGYINVIVPGKVLAFSSPYDGRLSKGMAFKPSMCMRGCICIPTCVW
jgi:hypothetical protein